MPRSSRFGSCGRFASTTTTGITATTRIARSPSSSLRPGIGTGSSWQIRLRIARIGRCGTMARELLLPVANMWLANALTLSRIPLAVVFWMTYGDPRLSIALVGLAALTDAADGTVARWAQRRRGGAPRSTAGEWLDPLADKIFVIGVLGAIQVHDPAPWGLIALIAARELVLIP